MMNISSAYAYPVMAIFLALISLGVGFLVGRQHSRRGFAEMRSRVERLREIIETAATGIITIDASGIILQFNLAAEEIFGWTREEAIGRNVKILMPEPDRSRHDEYIGTYLRTGEAKIIGKGRELLGLRKDGSTVPIRLAVSHASLPGKNFFTGMVIDISERVKIEQALNQREQQYRSLIANIPGISYRALPDDHRTALFVSDAAEIVTGYPAVDFIGPDSPRRFADVVHPDDIDRIMATVKNAIANKNSFAIEYRTFHRNGDMRWMWERGSTLLSENGEVQSVDGIIVDVTERKAMENELRKAKESAEHAVAARSAFLATISHEIRTPMNAILGFVNVLLTSDLNAEQRRQLDIVHDSARSLLHLLNDVLDSAKLGRGAVELEIIDFDLPALLGQVDATLGAQAREKGLAFNLHLHPRLATYYRGDPPRIRQILTNLLGNAIKFTEQGSITISVTPTDEGLLFAVRDTGIGIPSERIEKIFDPFTQANASMSRRFGGTGLGTSISKQLVELMGGRIWVESTPGNGSTFTFMLPLEQGEIVREKTRQAVNLPPLRILVVDDVAQNVELLEILLERFGHTVVPLTDGAEAARIATREHFDLILMDLHMPQVDGLEATRRIRAQEQRRQLPHTPIIALTASVFYDDRVAAMEAGMNGFAAKPVDIEELNREIARILGFAVDDRDEKTRKPRAPSTLDLAYALKLWGSPPAYLQALQRFLDDSETFPKTFRDMVAEGKLAAAREKVHRYRGTAANLGASRLAQTLQTLERQLKEENPSSFSVSITEIESLLRELEREAKTLKEDEPPAPAATKNGPVPPQITAELERLSENLRHGAIDETALARVRAALQDHELEPFFNQIEGDIAGFEFEGAINRSDELIKRLEELSRKT